MRARDTSATLKVVPRDQETEVARDATLLVSAPRPIDHLSTGGLRVRSGDREVEGVLDLSGDRRILFWRPLGALEARAFHQVTLTGVRDEKGACFDDLSTTFVTGGFSYRDLRLLVD
jgi:hypothetical protein